MSVVAPRPGRRGTLGVFDSGVGGLTVVRHLRRLLPGWPIVYFGDTARVPYGAKSDATVRRFANEAVSFLKQFEVSQIVVACNPVSAVAIRALQKHDPRLPIEGVIEAGAEAAVRAPRGADGSASSARARPWRAERTSTPWPRPRSAQERRRASSRRPVQSWYLWRRRGWRTASRREPC